MLFPIAWRFCDHNKQRELARAVPGCAPLRRRRSRHLAAWYAHYSGLKLCRSHLNVNKKDQRCEKKVWRKRFTGDGFSYKQTLSYLQSYVSTNSAVLHVKYKVEILTPWVSWMCSSMTASEMLSVVVCLMQSVFNAQGPVCACSHRARPKVLPQGPSWPRYATGIHTHTHTQRKKGRQRITQKSPQNKLRSFTSHQNTIWRMKMLF